MSHSPKGIVEEKEQERVRNRFEGILSDAGVEGWQATFVAVDLVYRVLKALVPRVVANIGVRV